MHNPIARKRVEVPDPLKEGLKQSDIIKAIYPAAQVEDPPKSRLGP
ncbi:MAG: hypothetical protein GY765_15975 [bacterium]|nr:hypothetical protein [bacterium]